MLKGRKIVYVLVLVFGFYFPHNLYSQENKPKKPLKIKAVENNPDAKKKSPLLLPSASKTKAPSILDKKNEINMARQSNLVNPSTIYEKKFNEKNPINKDRYFGDQYLGDFKSNAKSAKFLFRDHQAVDGDRIRVFVNGIISQPNIYLQGHYKGFDLLLEPGFNKVEFEALNQGASGPNTAELKVIDDKGNVISSKIWNLSTGSKATIIVVKELE
ncbi:hypothetical protein GWK08_09360 [Leptobacterium flavescens]|uniref:Secreted protein n=1 Tax=Leptobacterium flavescens TaxID=472055 RepID=A0A6P0UK91_9FLAO|nr:hypothetical protein [Leptobacterium flavescens]NER13644.1 hypothetical protein [Leptobacterium flavescens]